MVKRVINLVAPNVHHVTMQQNVYNARWDTLVQCVIYIAALTVCYHPAISPVLSVFMDVMMASGQLTAMRPALRTVRMASVMWQHPTALLVVKLVSTERLANCYVVLCAVMMDVTETQGNVPKDAEMNTMD